MLINLRGTNGSGKSTVVRDVMSTGSARPLYGVLGVRTPEGYLVDLPGTSTPVFVVGPYEVGSLYCGLDDRKLSGNYDSQVQLVRKYAAKGHVIFEGLICGKLWGRMGGLIEELLPVCPAVLIYLTTPVEECIRRVVTRRRQRGRTDPFNSKNLVSVFEQVQANRRSVAARELGGLKLLDCSSQKAPGLILKLLRGD